MAGNFYWRDLSKKIPAFIREFKNPKHIFFAILSVAILSWGIVYTNCGSHVEVSEEDLNILDSNISALKNQNSNPPKITSVVSCKPLVATGYSHTCVAQSGTVKCWGDNSQGQLGDGTTTSSGTPVVVQNLSNVIAISAQGFYTCAIVSGGSVKCWGSNNQGQLGNGVVGGFSSTPVNVFNLVGATKITNGYEHACVVVNGGTAKCWGRNDGGELGNGTSSNSSPVPVDVVSLSGINQIGIGAFTSCATLSNGTVKCWGENNSGQFGNGTIGGFSSTPGTVSNITTASEVDVGEYHACAVLSNGTVQCWGKNDFGQLGLGNTTQSLIPATVLNVSGAVAVDNGYYHSCAVLFNGTVKCWGANAEGEVGNGTFANATTPTSVSNLSGATPMIESTNSHICVITSNSSLKCWGLNNKQQLGNNTTTNANAPITASIDIVCPLISAGAYHACALNSSGAVKCWGNNYGNSPIQIPGLTSGIVSVSAGGQHTCALSKLGAVKCWGDNTFGQLGDGTNTSNSLPTQVSGLTSGVIAISSGAFHTCALLDIGAVKCWGNNQYNSIGDGTNIHRNTPTQVTGMNSGMIAISSGAYHACAISGVGGLQCWGYNNEGGLGDGTDHNNKSTPSQVVGLATNVIAVSSGVHHTCAILNTGGLKCWGENYDGEVGDGTSVNKNIPTQVSGFTSNVVGVSGGGKHTCAILNSGALQCWGNNVYGQLGDGTTVGKNTPTQVSSLTSNVAMSSSGLNHTCALLNGSTLKCWGDNGSGQVGNGSNNQQNTPVSVINWP